MEIRVLHWNIHSWREPRTGASVLAELAAATGYASLFAPTFEYGIDGSEGGFGNALLSRLPILAMRQRQLTWPDTVATGDERSEPRSVVLAKVARAGRGPGRALVDLR